MDQRKRSTPTYSSNSTNQGTRGAHIFVTRYISWAPNMPLTKNSMVLRQVPLNEFTVFPDHQAGFKGPLGSRKGKERDDKMRMKGKV